MYASASRCFVLLSLIFILLTTTANSQIPNTSQYKSLEISPTYPLPARTESMGNLEFAIMDSTRDPFINPAKIHMISQPQIFLSATLAGVNDRIINIHKLKTNKTRRTELTRLYNRLFPAGALFTYRNIYVGILGYFYQNGDKSEIKDDNKVNNNETTNILMKWDMSGNSFPFLIVTGVQISSKLFFGAGLKRFKIDDRGSFFSNKTEHDRITEEKQDRYQAAAHYQFNNQQNLYFLITRYKYFQKLRDDQRTSNESGFDHDNGGWAFQLEYRHKLTSNTSLSGRITLDLKDTKRSLYYSVIRRGINADNAQQTEEGDATALEFGIGGVHHQGRLTLAGEVLINPSKFKFKDITDNQRLNVRSEYTIWNWQLKLGSDIRINDWLFWQIGMNFSFFKSRQESEIQDSKNITDPFQKIGSTRLTTGLKLKYRNLEVIYHFSYNHQPVPKLIFTGQNYLNINYGYAPQIHRINIIYHFNF